MAIGSHSCPSVAWAGPSRRAGVGAPGPRRSPLAGTAARPRRGRDGGGAALSLRRAARTREALRLEPGGGPGAEGDGCRWVSGRARSEGSQRSRPEPLGLCPTFAAGGGRRGLRCPARGARPPPPRSLRSASERTPSRFGDRPGRVRWAGREQDCFSRGLCCADTPRPAQAALASLTLARRPQLLVRGAGGRPAGLRACLTGSGGGRRPGPWEAGICTRVGRTPLWAGTP